MTTINNNFLKLNSSYLFSRIASEVKTYDSKNAGAPIISLGIGDVTQGLPSLAGQAMVDAIGDMLSPSTFRGYGPEQGYDFLRSAIVQSQYRSRNVDIDADEIFVSDGAKSDTANIQELFSDATRIAMNDPVYPVYVDSNVIGGRTGKWVDGRYEGVVYIPISSKNNYRFLLPDVPVDLIYVCSPNNPTGAVATKEELQRLVDFALDCGAVIIYDAAYESFIRDPRFPRSIYEIPRACECAIECNSLSKSAGFTGLRCAYTVVPKKLQVKDAEGTSHSLRDLWLRRQTTKFNGVAYPIQRAAAAMFTPEGQAQIRELTDYYLKNATIIRALLDETSLEFSGGLHAPYIWINVKQDSWECFRMLLEEARVVVTPGAGFGPSGEGHIRISAFAMRESVVSALQRLRPILLMNWKK